MVCHELPSAAQDHQAVDALRRMAAELLEALPQIIAADPEAIWKWAGSAQYVLEELARG